MNVFYVCVPVNIINFNLPLSVQKLCTTWLWCAIVHCLMTCTWTLNVEKVANPCSSRLAVLDVHCTYGSKYKTFVMCWCDKQSAQSGWKLLYFPWCVWFPCLQCHLVETIHFFFNQFNYFWGKKALWALGSAGDRGATHFGGSAAIVYSGCADVWHSSILYIFNVEKVANPCSSKRWALDVHYIPHLLVLSLGNETPGGSTN